MQTHHNGRYFYARLALGTPPREYEAIIDTGSTITYVPCAGCKHCGKHTVRARVFFYDDVLGCKRQRDTRC
jgi:hypothetical protein